MNENEPKQEQNRYPADFIERVKAEFPNSENLHKALDAGGDNVGRYLDDNRGWGTLTPQSFLKLWEEGKEKEIRDIAAKSVRINDLFNEWKKINETR
ncbi:MAG: hypothetical protein WC878_03905 [Candidatus Paceibacterota bacterium]|jgi:hypothetical protein